MIDLTKVEPNVVQTGLDYKSFMFYGAPGTRKTTVAAQFPKSLVLATEIGYSLIPGVKAVPIANWAEFLNVLKQLEKPEVKEMYSTIVIDTVGLLTDMCVQYICQLNQIRELGELAYGKGWRKFNEEFRSKVNRITQLGYGLVLIAHADIKRDDSGNITSALPQLDNKPRQVAVALVDFILFLQKEPKDDNEEETTVYAYSDLPSIIDTKTRARHLSKRFEFNYENLQEEVKKAVIALEKDFGESCVSDTTKDARVSEKEDFDLVKEEVVKLAKELLDNKLKSPKVEAMLIDAMGGIPLSEADKSFYNVFISLRAALQALRDE